MTVRPTGSTLLTDTMLPFLRAQVWSRPELDDRDRRWVTLSCAAAAGTAGPLREEVAAALTGGAITPAELGEFALQFAVHCGWPVASVLDEVVRAESAAFAPGGSGQPGGGAGPAPDRSGETFETVMGPGIDLPDSPYLRVGVAGFVFAQVWSRPGLGLRDRRLIAIIGSALAGPVMPLRSHLAGALAAGELDEAQLRALALLLACHAGLPLGELVDGLVDEIVDETVGSSAAGDPVAPRSVR
ncbi:carboxymuconolactone decarboxylase family protein [Frankia sp. QA3]|uniref:carboxymuconolactone decarboxylase family protein n=1 Tax=Frankia sp. QA3 TaxID=710111 RepID=UPI000269C04C|nr:carboxymuconolactone decarboxylase family protein [Frankia sp. QA3]EIV92001.1 uncharacterized protein, gamma-carboxymuconolactone decarboxylase subunit like protein [Frankia sp. QA3]